MDLRSSPISKLSKTLIGKGQRMLKRLKDGNKQKLNSEKDAELNKKGGGQNKNSLQRNMEN